MVFSNNLLLGAVSAAASDYLIEQSLLFDGATYLSRTPGSSGSLTTWTFSVWVKRGKLSTGSNQVLMGANSGSGGTDRLGFLSGGGLEFGLDVSNGVSSLLYLTSNAVLKDSSAWYHLVYVWDTTNATSTDRGRIYVNGTRITSLASTTYPSQNAESTAFNKNVLQNLGRHGSADRYYDGLMALPTFIDGTALDPTSFAEEDDDGYWNPIDVSDLTYGTNGFVLDFSDTSNFGDDTSGNGNDYTPNNFTAADQLADTPTDDADLGIGNFATLNPNDKGGGTLSQGNRYFSSGSDKSIRATMSGTEKYQIEFFGYNELMFGLASAACALTGGNHYSDANSFMYYGYNGNKVNTTFTSYGSASTTDSTYVGMTYDPSNGDLRFYLNGIDQGTAFTMDTSVEWYPYIFLGALNQYGLMNFGQTPFEYPISGFTPLATQNFPAPTIADPSAYFETLLYTGNGSASQRTDIAFNTLSQPDFVWIKQRSSTQDHALHDSVRGVPERLESNTTGAAVGGSGFGSDGFGPNGVGSELRIFTADAQYNASGATYVAWGWKAGGTAVTNSIFSITSQVSVNTTSGFSIVTYTAPASPSTVETVGHGLGAVPGMMIWKNRTDATDWYVWHKDLAANNNLKLNSTAAQTNDGVIVGDPPASPSHFNTLGALHTANKDYVAYCWAEVEGFSKFGSYTGNGSADGPFVYTGFKPAFVMLKRTDGAASWVIMDNKRDTYNPANSPLIAEGSNAEGAAAGDEDFLSNGFKIRTTSTNYNASGGTYIYAAFAESPFQGDDGYTQARAR
jgi:hypothetical protein